MIGFTRPVTAKSEVRVRMLVIIIIKPSHTPPGSCLNCHTTTATSRACSQPVIRLMETVSPCRRSTLADNLQHWRPMVPSKNNVMMKYTRSAIRRNPASTSDVTLRLGIAERGCNDCNNETAGSRRKKYCWRRPFKNKNGARLSGQDNRWLRPSTPIWMKA